MKPFLYIVLLFTLLITSGCWDRTEINDLAFMSGTAFDLTEDGEYILSHQIAIPSTAQGGPGSGGSSLQEKFFLTSATGKSASEAFQKLQKKTSRTLFTSHRSVIFIGESLAKHGIQDILDVFTHDPRQRLRTYIMAVKGGEGRDILKIKYPFEQVSTEAVKEMESLESGLSVTLRDFFIAASSEGINPVLGVIMPEDLSVEKKVNKNEMFKLAGSAIFKDFKLVGFLNENETSGFLWVTGRMKYGRISAYLPEGDGTVGIDIKHAKRIISSKINGDKIKFKIQLLGQGSLWENNTPLDISLPENLGLVQKVLEKTLEKQVMNTITKVQKRYKVDSVGFGQEIYRNKPKQWKALKEQWDHTFPDVDIAVEVKLNVTGTGMSGAPLHLHEEEIIK